MPEILAFHLKKELSILYHSIFDFGLEDAAIIFAHSFKINFLKKTHRTKVPANHCIFIYSLKIRS